MSKRIVFWFSCGAASAVATKLALSMERGDREIVIAYSELQEEHPDNKRFLLDCQEWFKHPITVLKDEKYAGSIYEVFKRERFLVGPSGAACTRLLKREPRKKFQLPGDTQIFGYTSEEVDRLDDFKEMNPEIDIRALLIEHELGKADCLAMVQRAGIELPAMYKLGYRNNNCIGCVKGGAGYWNKIRVDFPEVFERMAQVEESLGRTINTKTKEGVKRRITLRELHPDDGRDVPEPDIECGSTCERAESSMLDTLFMESFAEDSLEKQTAFYIASGDIEE